MSRGRSALPLRTPPPPALVRRGPRSNVESRLHALALRIRPTELGSLLKFLLNVKRRYVETGDGLWFWVDPASQLGRQLAAGEAYEPSMAALMRAVLRSGDSFVDVGANEGVFTVLASSLCGDGKVVAVEPQSRLIPILHRNLELNGCTEVSVRSVALAASPGWVRLYLRPNTNPGSSGTTRRRLDVVSEWVPASTLDDVLDRANLDTVRLVKIDCEGAEGAVLDGARRALERRAAEFIAVEFHPTVGHGAVQRSRDLHDRLRSCGYVHSLVLGRNVYHAPGGELVLQQAGPVDVDVELQFEGTG